MRAAASLRLPLSARRYDLIVIGGGINGVAIARQCALAGKKPLLLEQRDFGSGTSSRSTRIIHGGLRYLEHGELGLVRESLRERERLIAERPQLVHPINFLLAMPKHGITSGTRSSLAVRAGLELYKYFSKAPRRCATPYNDIDILERSLDSGERWSLFNYEDGQCEFPERLIADWLVEAVTAGAVARNYTQVLAINSKNGRVTGITTRDLLTGVETAFESDWVVNATGPWVDQVCTTAGLGAKKMIGGVRGSHIVLPRYPGAPESAVYAEATDGRQVFVIPWNGQTLVGSTEVSDDGDPGSAQVTPDEFDYLFSSFTRIFPRSQLQPQQATACFAGIRPLPYSPGAKSSSVTRRHFLHDHSDDGAAGMISVVGGKLTTAASLARECARKVGAKVSEPVIDISPSTAGDIDQWTRSLRVGTIQFSPVTIRAIAEWHGVNTIRILSAATDDPLLAQRLCPHSDHLVAEALFAAAHEGAVHLGDILLRRVPVALGACWNQECTRHAAKKIGTALGWSESRIEIEIEAFSEERSSFQQQVRLSSTVATRQGAN